MDTTAACLGSTDWGDVGLHEDSGTIIPVMPLRIKYRPASMDRAVHCCHDQVSQGAGLKRSARKSSMTRRISGIWRRETYTP